MEYRNRMSLPPEDLEDAFVVLSHDAGTGWTVAGFVLENRIRSSDTALERAVAEDATLADRPCACFAIARADVQIARREEPPPPSEPPPPKVRFEPLPELASTGADA